MDEARRIKGLDCGQRFQNWRNLMRVIWNPSSRDLSLDLAVKLTWKDILKSSSMRSAHIRDW
jgi:hypothetical protein